MNMTHEEYMHYLNFCNVVVSMYEKYKPVLIAEGIINEKGEIIKHG